MEEGKKHVKKERKGQQFHKGAIPPCRRVDIVARPAETSSESSVWGRQKKREAQVASVSLPPCAQRTVIMSWLATAMPCEKEHE